MDEQTIAQQGTDQDRGDRGNKVKVTIDGVIKEIARGRYAVPALKIELGVSPTYELELVIRGEFKPLPDSEHFVVRGGETFVSHVPRGGNS